MQNNDKKVLLRISNLKQYFPLKGGRFVKANDGITLDIYEGETFGLVGESGCGKSTLGRTILQLYHQTYGRTMYYGRSLDDLAPKYVIDTVKNLKARRTKLRELEQKRDKLEADYAKLSEKEQYAKHGELDTARKLAEDALLDITKIVGGFLVVDDLDPVIAAYSKDYAIARKLSSMEEKRQELQVDVDDAEYAKKTAEEAGKSGKDGQLQKAQKVVFLSALRGCLNENGKILIGDVAFETRDALNRCRQEAGADWDVDEIYFVAEELKRDFPDLIFTQLSPCAGVLTISR